MRYIKFGFLCFFPRPSKVFTLNDVISMLEDDSEVASAKIYIDPPADGQNSDEDDVNAEVQESVSANDLSGSQLRSRAQARVTKPNGDTITLGYVSIDV